MKTLCLLSALLISAPLFAQYQSTPTTRTDSNLIIGSYNIKWVGQEGHDYQKLARVIANFDICAIQEVKHEKGLQQLVSALEAETNEDWGYFQGMRSRRPSTTTRHYFESHAVIWRKDRVQPSDGLQGNIWDEGNKWRNDPAIFSFEVGNFDFILASIHTRWSDDEDGTRAGEVESLETQVKHLNNRFAEKDVIIVGDFNYSGTSSQMEDLVQKIDYRRIDFNPKTTFKSDHSDYANSYDHILISNQNTSNEYPSNNCYALDVTTLIYGDKSVANMQASKSELSDHLPVYAVFKTNGTDDD